MVHLYTNLTGVGNVEVNAFQLLSEVVIQKSLREGFGLVVSEALWKRTPVVAGRAGGIPMQMPEGVGGLLVDSVEECASAIVKLLCEPELAAALGASGREHVREHYLLPRLLMEELEYNILFRWFVGLNLDDAVWVPTVFSKNRDRCRSSGSGAPRRARWSHPARLRPRRSSTGGGSRRGSGRRCAARPSSTRC